MRLVKTYDRLHRHVRAWADGEIESLLMLGRPGTGKSHAFRDTLGQDQYHLFSARKTPVQVYVELHDSPSLPVVFDDVSALLRDPNFLDMLKNLLETGPRTVRWGTSTPLLEERPQSFVFTGRVLIVLNRMPEEHPDVMAILDRCDCIEFDPPKPSVIARMRDIFPEDGELIDLLAELPVIPSLRTLVKARQWQQSQHLDWREELIAECGVSEGVGALLDIMQSGPEAEWLGRFTAATGQTDRSYRRHRKIADQVLACRASEDRCPNAGGAADCAHDPEYSEPNLILPFSPAKRSIAANAGGGSA